MGCVGGVQLLGSQQNGSKQPLVAQTEGGLLTAEPLGAGGGEGL